jgi:hypothetical protein
MASVSNSTSSRSPVHFLTEEKIFKKEPIVINFDILEAKYGINPDEIGVAFWASNANLVPISADSLLGFSLDLEESKFKFEANPPIAFTFKGAMEYVIHLIEHSMQKDPIFVGFGKGDNLAKELFLAIRIINTKRPDLIPAPPHYSNHTYSACIMDNNYWMGAILAILWDQGQIREYGNKGGDFWVKL